MQFEKKQVFGSRKNIFGILIKFISILLILAISIILIDRINFPTPIKKIEKVISNENFKIVK
tara:strand:- start:21 stop:206 length:186 start_codon:yes stop_codon:yes gene_type:complete